MGKVQTAGLAVLMVGLLPLCPVASLALSADFNVAIQPVTFEELSKEVVKHRGKVVVVDCWFVGCVPCYECLKHLSQVQKKRAGDGMITLTVCINILDDPWPKYEKDANNILKKLDIHARNRLLKLSYNEAEKKMQLPGSFPTVFVFNRQGKWRQFSGEQVGDPLDTWIMQCLKEKNVPPKK